MPRVKHSKRSRGHRQFAGETLECRRVLNSAPVAVADQFSVQEGGVLSVGAGATSGALIERGAEWLYLADGADLGTSWRAWDYADSWWFSGPAELGYGDGDEQTVVPSGPSPFEKFITTYFRRHFEVGNPAAVTALDLDILRDDGAVVYINGQEVLRDNMPDSQVTYRTLALSVADERAVYRHSLNPGVLRAGDNTIAVEIHQVNQTSSDISFDLALHAAGTAQSGGVLANDSDADGDLLAARLVSGVSHGQLELRENGSFTYAPEPGYSGDDQFTYTAGDGQNTSNEANVTIAVTPRPNSAPQARNDSYSVARDGLLDVVAAAGVLANDSDADGDALEAALVDAAAHGSVTLRPDGSLTYAPDAGFAGLDQFSYRAVDNRGASSTATVTIRVDDPGANQPPIAQNDVYSTPAGQRLEVVGGVGVPGGSFLLAPGSVWKYLANGVDLGTSWAAPAFDDAGWLAGPAELGYGDGDEATVVDAGPLGQRPPTVYFRATFYVPDAAAVSALNLGLKVDDGAVVYLNGIEIARLNMPDGPIHFNTLAATGAANDGRDWTIVPGIDLSALANVANTLAVEVHQVNLTSSDISFDLSLGTGGGVAAAGVLLNDFDADGDPLSAQLVATAAHGSLELRPDGSFTYTPNVGFVGDDQFTYVANDSHALSNVATVTIHVTGDGGPVNHAPVAWDDEYQVTVDETLYVSATAIGEDALVPAGSVWKYLADGGDQQTAWREEGFDDSTWLSGPAELGYGDGDEATVVLTGQGFLHPPTAYFRAAFDVADTSAISALSMLLKRDDGAVVYLNGVEIARSNMPDGPIGYATLALTVTNDDGREWIAYPQLDPAPLHNGTNTLAVEIHQAQLTSSDISFDLQLAAGTMFRPGLLLNDTDQDGDRLAAQIAGAPSHGSVVVEADGSFTYTPESGFVGDDTFTYTVSDGAATSNLATVTIHVLPLPEQAPLAEGDMYQIEAGALEVPAAAGVLGNDVHPAGAALAAVLVSGTDYGQLDLSADGSFVYQPDSGFHGVDHFVYRAQSGQTASADATVIIAVSPTTVAGRYVFYNNSRFDGRTPAASAADDGAIAPDKAALLPGGSATFANYTSYSRGINGLMIDLANLHSTPTLGDFIFTVGNDPNGQQWIPAPSPASLTVRRGAGVGGADRLTLVWPDGAIKKQWLQVNVLATPTTGLAAADLFYFGNAVGEAGNAAGSALVNAADEIGARVNYRNLANPATIGNVFDFNRDGQVNAGDQLIARANTTNLATTLSLMIASIGAPAPGPSPIVGLAPAALAEAALDGGAVDLALAGGAFGDPLNMNARKAFGR